MTNVELLAAVHEQVEAAVTATLPVPPSGGNAETLGCPMLKVQVVEGLVGVDDLSLQAPAASSAATPAPKTTPRLD